MKSNRNVNTCDENYLVLKINLCNFLLLKMAKRKCKFTDEMTVIHPCFRKGRNEWGAECLVCKPGHTSRFHTRYRGFKVTPQF